MKFLVRLFFRLIARIILHRHHPLVIAVAGSVGKTAAKDAIAVALAAATRRVRKTQGNFNAEIGVPATIMCSSRPPRSVWGWGQFTLRGIFQALIPRPYPQALVLELAADHPGDLHDLLTLVHPGIGVLTSLAPEHLEFFGDEAGVVAEESNLVRSLTKEQVAVVNIDDPRIVEIIAKVNAKVVSYGWSPAAVIRAESLTVTRDNQVLPDGMVAKIAVDGSVIPVAIPGVLGRHQLYPILAAIAVGRVLGDDAVTIVQRLSQYKPPPGRMRLFHGREGSLLIDDTYNASPEAVMAALETLRDLDVPNQKIAILGQMSELGAAAADWHERIGRSIVDMDLDELVTVGPLAARIGEAAVAAGYPSPQVQNVDNAESAAAAITQKLAPGVAVLLKGSRFASRLERAVAVLLDNPDRDQAMLVQGHRLMTHRT